MWKWAQEAFAPTQTDPGEINDKLRKWSVLGEAGELPPTLMGHLESDPIVGVVHARLMENKRIPQVDVDILRPGTSPFIHGFAHQGMLSRFRRKAINLLRRVSGQKSLPATRAAA